MMKNKQLNQGDCSLQMAEKLVQSPFNIAILPTRRQRSKRNKARSQHHKRKPERFLNIHLWINSCADHILSIKRVMFFKKKKKARFILRVLAKV